VKEPVDHILRPRLPWRTDEGAITECGFDATKVKTLTRDEFFARLKDYGQQRSALLTCMTCSDTARRWPTWQDEPRLALEREIAWERPHYMMYRETAHIHDKNGARLRDELLAIEALIAAHREEYLALLASIDARRQWLDRKSKNERAQ